MESKKILTKCKKCKLKIIQARGLCKNHYDKYLKKKNPEYAKRQRENAEEWAKRNRKRLAEYGRGYARNQTAKRYGITRQKVDFILRNGCELCGKRIGICIDHSHTTGKVRGALCITCNVGVGWIEKKDWYRKALIYLTKGEKR